MDTPTIDPVEALRRMTPADIEARLDENHAESVALRTILRSLRARERARSQPTARREAHVHHA